MSKLFIDLFLTRFGTLNIAELVRSMKKAGKRKRSETVKEESVRVGLIEWRRSWGRPSTLVLVGTLLFTLPLPFALLTGGGYCLFSLLADPSEFWIKFAGAITLMPLGAYTLTRALKFYRYYRSFSLDEESQHRFDESLERVTQSPASVPRDSQDHNRFIGECLAELRSGYYVRPASREERRQISSFLRKTSPELSPVMELLDAYFVSDQNDRSCLWVVVESSRESLTHVGRCQGAMVKLDAEVGTMLLRRQVIADTFIGLLTPIEILFPDSPKFCSSYFVVGDPITARPEKLPNSLRQALAAAEDLVVRTEDDLMMIVDNGGLSPAASLPIIEVALSALSKKASTSISDKSWHDCAG